MKKIIILIILAIILILLNIKKDNSNVISIDEMYAIIDAGIIIDVRTEADYNEGHILNSINIPLEQIDIITEIINDKNKQIFIYCNVGRRSNEALMYLESLGFNNVYDVGGIKNIEIELTKD